MGSAFGKNLVRAITSSWGRFFAILGIVALGCGFFAGLNMVGRDMRLAADAYYDDTKLYDIRLISTMGLTDSQIGKIAATDGVEAVMASRSVDAMVSLNDDQYAVRISSLPDAAKTGDAADESYLNQIELVEGSWPTSPDECVMSYDAVMREDLKLGDTVEVLYGSSDLSNVLTSTSFVVVGFVRNADFVDASYLGTTTLGSGKVEQYLFVDPSAFADDVPYTQAYIAVAGARAADSFSDEYQGIVDSVKGRLTDEKADLAQDRLDEIKSAAQEKVDEGQSEYERQKDDAEQQLDDARRQLDDALATLQENQAKLDQGRAEAASGWQQLEASRREAKRQLAAAEAQLQQNQDALDAAERQLGMSQEDIDAARKKLEAGRQELESGKVTWQETRSTLVQAESDMTKIQGVLDTFQIWLQRTDEPTEEEIASLEEEVRGGIEAARDLYALNLIDFESPEVQDELRSLGEEVVAQFEGIDFDADPEEVLSQIKTAAPKALTLVQGKLQGAIDEVASGIAEGDQKIADAEQKIEDSASQLDQAQAARDQIDQGKEQLASGWAQYESQKAQAESQLAAAEQQLRDADAEIASGQAELDQGYESYQEGLAEYEKSRKTALDELADAAQQLQNAQDAVDSLEGPDIYILDRSQGVGQVSYENDLRRIDSIAHVFPLFFFLVAALVALTSMTRMVEDDRGEIGTLKALGYTTFQIAQKYLVYALIASLAGCIVGSALLTQLLPSIVMNAYGIMYVVPVPSVPLSIDLPTVLIAAAAGIGITLIATFAAVWAEMQETPAALMQPKAPKVGKRILLERILPLWSRLGFLWKVTFRNIFRYKKRLIMTIVGIAGCTALLVTGLGVRDAIQDIITNQFDEIVHFNVDIGLADGATDQDKAGIISYLEDAGECTGYAWGADLNMKAGTGDAEPQSIRLIVPDDCQAFENLVTMRERVGHAPVTLDDSSVLVSEKLATQLGISVGDTILIFDQDEIGNATGTGTPLVVTGIVENYISYYVYAGKDAYREAFGHEAGIDHLYAKVGGDASEHREMMEALHSYASADTVIFNDETISTYRAMLTTVDEVMVILVVAAALLAFIVLYNLTNINISERIREIASLKVLGFTKREVRSYIFRETMLLTVLGALVGLFGGFFMEQFVVVTAEVDFVMFGREIHAMSYLAAFATTLAFTLIVMAALSPKLARIDMVESLKSVD